MMNRFGELFNEYQNEFILATEPTEEKIDLTITIRYRLFGNKQDMLDTWNKEHPDHKDDMFWMSVSTNPCEVWGLLRKARGRLVLNHLAQGHEDNHCQRVVLSNWTLQSEKPEEDGSPFLSPDCYTEI